MVNAIVFAFMSSSKKEFVGAAAFYAQHHWAAIESAGSTSFARKVSYQTSSLCLCASVVNELFVKTTTETQRHRGCVGGLRKLTKDN